MPIDDEALWVDLEFAQDFFAKPCFVNQREIRIFRFMGCFWVLDKISFESGDSIFAEERRGRSAPEIPEQVELMGFASIHHAINGAFDCFKQGSAGVRFAIYGHWQKFALFIDRDAAMEDEIFGTREGHASV